MKGWSEKDYTDNVVSAIQSLTDFYGKESLSACLLTFDDRVFEIYLSRKTNSKTPSFYKIKKTACEMFNITINEINSKSREREVVDARRYCYYYMKHNTNLSLTDMGKLFNQTHATVLNAIRQHQDISDTDLDYRNSYLEFLKLLKLKITLQIK